MLVKDVTTVPLTVDDGEVVKTIYIDSNALEALTEEVNIERVCIKGKPLIEAYSTSCKFGVVLDKLKSKEFLYNG